ncbi:MAG TPA: hypothetical protein VGC56_03565 [Allosphingosinicella sp.]|jgi:hypothetical protein
MISLTALLLAGASAERPAHPLSFYVDRLGTTEATSQLEPIDAFGCTAIPSLVEQLRIVTPGHYPAARQPERVLRAIFLIAALRTITARDFYGDMPRRALRGYDAAGRQFLTDDAPKGRAKFFGWWPSRGTFYVAPERAQTQIIAAWRAYARSGACRHSSWLGSKQSGFYLGGNPGRH